MRDQLQSLTRTLRGYLPLLALIGIGLLLGAGMAPPGEATLGTLPASELEVAQASPPTQAVVEAAGAPSEEAVVAAPPSADTYPPGFPPEDRFSDISEACVQLTKELVPQKWQRAVYGYCEHRSWASSRYNVIKSKVDGSQVHDRDRPFAWMFYNRGVITGRLDPATCEHHRIDKSIRHPREGRRLARDWPFGRPKMSARLSGQWFDHAHDMERFGTRGPHDNNLANAIIWVPGCYPPEALDRNDVNATATILRSVAICEDYGCATKADVKKHWRHGPKRRPRAEDEQEEEALEG